MAIEHIGIMGAGVAGLSVAHLLRDSGLRFDVFDQDEHYGGLARSHLWHGFPCDLAPHRFFTSDANVLRAFKALVPLERMRRKSRIFIQGHWIQDPVNAVEMVLKFSPAISAQLIFHYLFRKQIKEDNFEALALNQFGKSLNRLFFKPYSEKLFGIPATEISPTWGRRKLRVGGLKDMIRRQSRLYFKEFYYPAQHGYGAIVDALYKPIRQHVHLQHRLTAFQHLPDGHYEATFDHKGHTKKKIFSKVISSLPLNDFSRMLGLDLPLHFRAVAEFANFNAKSFAEDQTVLCCEVTDTREFSVERVVSDLARAALLRPEEILDTKVMDLSHAYPIYDRAYDQLMVVAEKFYAQHPNLFLLGRQANFAHQDIDEIYLKAQEIAQRLQAPPA
ncbi:MAG: NAD(P)-binding protein [Kiritimatiellaeota bacterium]|nr:NAD(P)-binding protein [Kiritimatiellota bacterium]